MSENSDLVVRVLLSPRRYREFLADQEELKKFRAKSDSEHSILGEKVNQTGSGNIEEVCQRSIDGEKVRTEDLNRQLQEEGLGGKAPPNLDFDQLTSSDKSSKSSESNTNRNNENPSSSSSALESNSADQEESVQEHQVIYTMCPRRNTQFEKKLLKFPLKF